MSKHPVTFLIANLPYTLDISDEKAWDFIQREFQRDFPWLLDSGYLIILSGVGKGWCGRGQRGCVVSRAAFRGIGKIPLDALLAWMTHFVDALAASRSGRVVGIAPTPEAGFGFALARSLARKERVRLVVRVQGHTASRSLLVHRSRWRFRLLEWIESFVIRRADLVIPMGEFTRQLALKKGANQGRIIVLPFPVRWMDSAMITDLPPRPCVLFAGRLEKEKGVHILLEALKHVKKAVPSVRLLIAGDGSYRQHLEELVGRLQLSQHVSFLGWLAPEEIWQAYREAWVLVLPSILAEGLGMVLVEAGLMGRPVIGSGLGGIRDIIQHGYNGFLVPPGNAKALAEAILTVLMNRDLAHQMGLANLEVAWRYLSQRDEALERVRRAILALVNEQ